MKIGYVRVSTIDQNPKRQENMLSDLGIEKVFVIKIETKTGERILYHDFSGGGYPSTEGKLFDMINDLIHQGLASHIEESRSHYPSVVKVPKATDLVKKIMLPVFRVWCQLQEKEALEKYEQEMDVRFEALKSFPCDEGLVITAWRTL